MRGKEIGDFLMSGEKETLKKKGEWGG